MISEEVDYRVKIYLNNPEGAIEDAKLMYFGRKVGGEEVWNNNCYIDVNSGRGKMVCLTNHSKELVEHMSALTLPDRKHGFSVYGKVPYDEMSEDFEEIWNDINENSELLDEFARLNEEGEYRDTLYYIISNENGSEQIKLGDQFLSPIRNYARALNVWLPHFGQEFKDENEKLIKQTEKVGPRCITGESLRDALETDIFLYNNDVIKEPRKND